MAISVLSELTRGRSLILAPASSIQPSNQRWRAMASGAGAGTRDRKLASTWTASELTFVSHQLFAKVNDDGECYSSLFRAGGRAQCAPLLPPPAL